MNIKILTLIVFICNFTTFLRGQKLVTNQYEALKSLYDSTDGKNWYIQAYIFLKFALYIMITIIIGCFDQWILIREQSGTLVIHRQILV